jgi:hypothetical protein
MHHYLRRREMYDALDDFAGCPADVDIPVSRQRLYCRQFSCVPGFNSDSSRGVGRNFRVARELNR